jgi:hypothetical protein
VVVASFGCGGGGGVACEKPLDDDGGISRCGATPPLASLATTILCGLTAFTEIPTS